MSKVALLFDKKINTEYYNEIVYFFVNTTYEMYPNVELTSFVTNESVKKNFKYIIYFCDRNYPKNNAINKIKKIIKLNEESCYLSEDIMLLRVSNVEIVDKEIVKNFSKNYELFDRPENTNPLTHIYPEKYDTDYLSTLKLYNSNYMSIFGGLGNKQLKCFVDKKFSRDKCYAIICFIDDKNFNDWFINFSNIKYKNIRIFVLNNCKVYDNVQSIIKKCKVLKNVVTINYKQDRVKHVLLDFIKDKLKWFEQIVLVNNFKNMNIDKVVNDLNKCYMHKNLIYYRTGIISCVARYFCLIPFISRYHSLELHELYEYCKNYLLDKYEKDCIYITSYKKKLQNRQFIGHNTSYEDGILLRLCEYTLLKNNIADRLANNKDRTKLLDLYGKKISLHFLTDDTEGLETEFGATILNGSPEILSMIALLITNNKNNTLKELFINKSIELFKQGNTNSTVIFVLNFFLSMNTFKKETLENMIYLMDQLTNNEAIVNDIIKKNYLKEVNVDAQKFKGQLIPMSMQYLGLHVRFNLADENLHNKYLALLKINMANESEDNIKKLFEMKNCNHEYIFSVLTEFNPYFNTKDEVIMNRERINRNTELLLKYYNKKHTLVDMLKLSPGNFYLSYQGLPSRDIFIKKSQLIRKMCDDLNYKINLNYTNEKINICFHSKFLSRHHSVYKDRHQVIKHMSLDSRFNVYFSTFDKLDDYVKHNFGNAKHILLDNNLEKNKQTLESLKLDVLVFCEIGMCAQSFYLAHMKLAKVQLNTWGHSDTSGIDTIDYYVSSKLYELPYEEAQTHYSEKLILTNSLSTCYVNPVSQYNINNFKKRLAFGFTSDMIVYFCAQSAFKFSPHYDDYIIGILKNSDNTIIALQDNGFKERILKRFDNKGIAGRIHYFPGMKHFDYLNLMHACDIILDPYPFGGCNSSFEAFSIDKPVVTQPSQMINGRFTHGFYQKMNILDTVCNSMDEYINCAVRLAKDKGFYNLMCEKIKKNKHVLFSDMETVDEWKQLVIDVLEKTKNNS